MPDFPKRSQCRGCKRPILWVRSAVTGRTMPLDADPITGGTFVIVHGQARLAGNQTSPAVNRYRSHFATCPEAERFRNKKQEQASEL